MQLLADGHQCPVYSVRTVTRDPGSGGLSYRWLAARFPPLRSFFVLFPVLTAFFRTTLARRSMR